ncbi:hypothetical protein DFJ77DRAFT_513227 [Powellomyces hirtus]|nr:hypothetical protein DFJ77DRAFT_513227 [Powellomyces hirtus]
MTFSRSLTPRRPLVGLLVSALFILPLPKPTTSELFKVEIPPPLRNDLARHPPTATFLIARQHSSRRGGRYRAGPQCLGDIVDADVYASAAGCVLCEIGAGDPTLDPERRGRATKGSTTTCDAATPPPPMFLPHGLLLGISHFFHLRQLGPGFPRLAPFLRNPLLTQDTSPSSTVYNNRKTVSGTVSTPKPSPPAPPANPSSSPATRPESAPRTNATTSTGHPAQNRIQPHYRPQYLQQRHHGPQTAIGELRHMWGRDWTFTSMAKVCGAFGARPTFTKTRRQKGPRVVEPRQDTTGARRDPP